MKYFVKHYHCIPPSYGGVQVYVKRLMLSLCKRGLISGAFRGVEIEGIPKEFEFLLDLFPKHARSLFILPEFLRLINIFKDYQIIHSHSSFSTALGIWMLHKMLRKPVVYTVHNQMIDREYSFLNALDRFCIRSLASDKTVQFITVNDNGKNDLLNRNLKFANDIIVMPAYIPPVEIGCPSDYLSKSLVDFLNKKFPALLFYAESFAVSEGKEIYGATTIIDLFISLKKVFPKLRLVFCLANINNDLDKLKEFKKRIAELGFNEDVYWQIGAISEFWPLLKFSVALVRPTTTDGDSVMVREALSYGLPVIASDVAQRPDGCIVYRSNDEEDLFKKVESFLFNPYRKEYPQIDYTENMIEIYKRLLS